jgi:hypothetical protein
MKAKEFGTEIQKVWKGNPKGVEVKSKGFGKEIPMVWK